MVQAALVISQTWGASKRLKKRSAASRRSAQMRLARFIRQRRLWAQISPGVNQIRPQRGKTGRSREAFGEAARRGGLLIGVKALIRLSA